MKQTYVHVGTVFTLCCIINTFADNPPITVNNYTNFHTSNSFKENMSTSFTNSQKQKSAFTNTTFYADVKDTLRSIHPKKWAHNGINFMSLNKFKIIGISVMSILGYLWYVLIADYNFMEQSDLWCAWCDDLNIDKLEQKNQKELADKLILEIQRKYVNEQNPTDFITPLVTFLQAIQTERKRINRFLFLAKYLYMFRLRWAFPLDDERILVAKKRRDRLAFIMRIFSSWSAQYNIQTQKLTD